MSCHALLQGIFLTQGSNPSLFHLLHWQVGSPTSSTWKAHMLRGRFILAFIPLGVPGSVARSLTLIWINSRSLLFQIFLLFLSISSNVYVVPFRVPPSPAFLHTLFYFCIALPILFFLLFSIGGLYWYILRDYLFNYVHSYNKLIKSEMKLLSRVLLFVTLWTVAYQALLSTWFSRQEDWSGLSFPSPGDLPNPVIKPGSPAL